jgi:glucosamine-6-phosphate deaminase
MYFTWMSIRVFLINGDAVDIKEEIRAYEAMLKEYPTDIACIGIGENGHIAFNDPPVANFNDPELLKTVQLDEACRRQQVGEGWFPTLEDVPEEAFTLTVPAIMNAKVISCVVPGQRKAQAISNTLNAEIDTACPATVLRRHPHTVLFLDKFSASGL